MRVILLRASRSSSGSLEAVLTAARDTRIAAGWVAEDIGSVWSYFFASRAAERVLVGIERLLLRNPV
jgi:hypothetical protein